MTFSVFSAVALVSLSSVGAAQGPPTWTERPDSPTVGDTIYLERTLPAPPGATARARPLSRTPTVEPLAEPVVERQGRLLTVRYAVALFEPGVQAVPMPAVEVLYADGTSETVLGDTARVRVRSVLPAGDSVPAPRPSLAPIPRPLRHTAPLAVLAVLVMAGGGLWAASRRRVASRPEAASARAAAPLGAAPIETWVEAGELRAVAAGVTTALRRELARRVPAASTALSTDACLEALRRERPGWPLGVLADVLHALDRARFAPEVPQDVMALVEQARMVSEQLAQQA